MKRIFTAKRFMILRLLTKPKMQIIVMPAWMAGIQVRKNASENIHVAWIPPLHAGMTQSKAFCMN
jgi:hypothetical protein